MGITDEQLATLDTFETGSTFTEIEKQVLRYAEGMTTTPVFVTDDLYNSLTKHFDERQLVELTSAIAWQNYRARFDHAFGIEAQGFDTPNQPAGRS